LVFGQIEGTPTTRKHGASFAWVRFKASLEPAHPVSSEKVFILP
jgi:hypothetical protein